MLAIVVWTIIIGCVVAGVLLTHSGLLLWHDRLQAQREARMWSEIAELTIAFNMPSAPSSPRWQR